MNSLHLSFCSLVSSYVSMIPLENGGISAKVSCMQQHLNLLGPKLGTA